jgi:hypothetical protein
MNSSLSVVAPTFTGPFKKAYSYSTTAAACLVQSVFHGAFERKSRDTVATDTAFLHCPKQHAQAIVDGNFLPSHLVSLAREKNSLTCLN